MEFPRNSRINTRLVALVLVFLASFGLYSLYCVNTVSEVKINGPFYKRIIQGKDVIADILPPPEYLIEAYLTAHQMLDAGGGAELDSLESRFGRLRADYHARHDFWIKDLPEGELKRVLVVDSYGPALRMLEAVETEFLPALRSGNKDQARTVLALMIRREYDQHRAAIDRVVEMAVARNRDDEARADVAVRSRTYGQIALGVFLFFILSIFSTYVVQKGEGPSRTAGRDGDADGASAPEDPGSSRESPPSTRAPGRTRA